jgi:hypothetical protein
MLIHKTSHDFVLVYSTDHSPVTMRALTAQMTRHIGSNKRQNTQKNERRIKVYERCHIRNSFTWK